ISCDAGFYVGEGRDKSYGFPSGKRFKESFIPPLSSSLRLIPHSSPLLFSYSCAMDSEAQVMFRGLHRRLVWMRCLLRPGRVRCAMTRLWLIRITITSCRRLSLYQRRKRPRTRGPSSWHFTAIKVRSAHCSRVCSMNAICQDVTQYERRRRNIC
ncbi:hypothetical protein Tcan_00336, partial [Toxocara canis]